MSPSIRIAMLNADTPVPNVRPKWDTYGSMFHTLLVGAASRISPNIDIHSSHYDVQKFEYPESLNDVDVLLVTGAAAAAYDQDEWVFRLDKYVQDVYIRYPHVKIFGSCFGHQLVCQSLLRGHGVLVEKDPNGWELGVHELQMGERFRKTLGRTSKSFLKPDYTPTIPEKMKMQMIHADHVRIPESGALPESWMTVGRTKHCALQGLYQPNRVLTFQGHFEFDRFISTELMKVFGKSWDPKTLQATFEGFDADDDAEAVAELVLQFLLEKEVSPGVATHNVIDGLLTPPNSE